MTSVINLINIGFPNINQIEALFVWLLIIIVIYLFLLNGYNKRPSRNEILIVRFVFNNIGVRFVWSLII
jgi:hypothetical protein